MNPELSICIPTFNRANHLQATLECITNDPSFLDTDEIEIVVSDNCSSDGTEELCRSYSNRFGSKFVYHRNESNLKDQNFELSLRLGRGNLLKLINDTAILTPGTLLKFLNVAKEYKNTRPLVFVADGRFGLPLVKDIELVSRETFMAGSLYWKTWIATFAIWSEDLKTIEGFSRDAGLLLVQVDVTMRLLRTKSSVLVLGEKCFEVQTVAKKGGYNLAEVFGNNYLEILSRHSDFVSRLQLKREAWAVYSGHIIPWVARSQVQKAYFFETGGVWPLVRKHFRLSRRIRLRLIYLYCLARAILSEVKSRVISGFR